MLKMFKEKQSGMQSMLLIVSSIVLSLISSYLYMIKLVAKVYDENAATLSELITGPSIFKDYYKPADFLIPRRFMISFLVLFLVFYLLTSIMFYLRNNLSVSFYAVIFAAGFVGFKQYFGYDMKFQWMIIAGLFILHLVDLIKKLVQKERYDQKALAEVCAYGLVAYFGVRAFIQMLLTFGMISESAAHKGFLLMLTLAYLTLVSLFIFGERLDLLLFKSSASVQDKKSAKFSLKTIYTEGAQALLLCFVLTLWSFKVNFNGVMESVAYRGIKISMLIVLLAILVYAILCIRKKDFIGKLHPYTLMIIGGMQLVMNVPVDEMFPVNLFHYGELTVPFTELVSFHKLPYLQFFPIHGICDYFFATINAILLDGTYGSFFYAYYIGSLILVAIVAYVVYKCMDNSFYAVATVAFFLTIGEWYYYFRFVLVLPILLIFFHEKVRKDAYKSLITYVVTSIISIAWYPAIGGSLAVALLIPLCVRVFSKEGRTMLLKACTKEEYKKYLPSFIATLLLGFSFVPMFFGIVRYLKENVGISGYFPGDRLNDLIVSAGSYSLFKMTDPFFDVTLIVFAFMIAIIIAVGLMCYYKKWAYAEAFIAIVVFCYMICSYTFGSIFAGERGAIVNVVLFILLAYILYQAKSESKLLPGFLIAFAFLLNTYNFAYAEQSDIAYQQISDQFVKLSGEEIGCEKIGTVYLPPETKQEVSDIAFVVNALCPEGETYLDFTNQSAFYMMFDKETPFAYCALYHGTSDATREQMLNSLKEDLPKLILVTPYWHNDGGSISLRYKEIYQYILSQGYASYQYGSVCFLLSNDVAAPDWAENGSDAFFGAMMTQDLQGLPSVWGRSADIASFETVDFEQVLLQVNGMDTDGNGTYYVTGDNPYFQISFSGESICADTDYLLMHFNSPDLADREKINLKLYFSYPDGPAMEEIAVSCTAENGDLLIPIYSYPMWNMFEMTTIRFDIPDEDMQGKSVNVSFELLKDRKESK